MLAVLLLGMIGYRDVLPVAALPTVDVPTIQVVTQLSRGARPEVMATSVTAPLEHYFGRDRRADRDAAAAAAQGTSQITLAIRAATRSIDSVAQDVQAADQRVVGDWVPTAPLPEPADL